MAKIPYFPFYPDDWLSSPRVMTMTYEQRGLYIHLLAMAWKMDGCSIPNDPALIRRLCPGARMTNIMSVLESCFVLTGETGAQRWQNPRAATDYLHALHKREMASKSVKHTKRFISKQSNDNRTINRTIISPEPEPEEPYVKPKKPPANPSIRILQDHLKSAFEVKFGSTPVMSYPAIGKQLKILLEKEKFTEEALKEMIDWFLTSPKASEHPTPAAAISTDTVQRWQVACPESR